jgi:hypothetical protein
MKTSKVFLFSFGMLMLSTIFPAYRSSALTGNDKDAKNTPTHNVVVSEVIKQNEIPRELRSKTATINVVNTLGISGFNISAVADGKYTLAFNLEKTGTTYIRIVDNGGYDVYFETFKSGTTYNKQIDLSLLPAGNYFFQVTQRGNTFTKKLIFS